MTLRSICTAGAVAGAVSLFSGCSPEPGLTTRSAEALRHYEEGVHAYELFYYREALESFSKAVEEDSSFAMAWGRISQVHYRNHNEERAKAAIETALAHAEGITERERLYLRMWDSMIGYAFAAAASVADSLVELYPNEKEAYLTRGFLYEADRKFKDAILSYHKAVAIDSGFAIAVMSLGYAHSAIGEQDLALQYMRRYIRLAPDAADPRASYADLLLWSGRYEEALEQYRKSLEIKPDYWYAIHRIGNIYLLLGRLRESEAQMLEAYDLLPEQSRPGGGKTVIRAIGEMYRGRYEQAAEMYLAVLAEDTTLLEAAVGLTSALTRLRRFDEADQVLTRIQEEFHRRGLESSSGMVEYHLVRARYFTAMDQLDSALASCDRAVQIADPRSRAAVYRQYAEVYLRRRAFESALEACDEALRQNPNYPPALLVLARVYHARGDAPMTEEIGRRLLGLWKDADQDFREIQELRSLLKGRRMPA